MSSLFQRYPGIDRAFPRVRLSAWPTPVTRLSGLERDLGSGALFFKDDGACGDVYGGNKVRKLELLLARALERGCREVVTFGYAGSNHAVATEVYGANLGLHVTSMLVSQPNARYVRRNLAMAQAFGAELHHFESAPGVVLSTAAHVVSKRLRSRRPVEVIPPGGSSLLGSVGYVAAAFELAEQITGGVLPSPARLYVALGTMGTAAGLAVGLAAAGIDTEVIGVRVVDERFASQRKLTKRIEALGHLLRGADPSFFAGSVPARAEDRYFGTQYGRFTERGMAAVRRVAETDAIALEGTYTGKTMAALIDRERQNDGRPVLFWNTHNGHDLSAITDRIDYRVLPAAFHRYFTHPVQALDREARPISHPS